MNNYNQTNIPKYVVTVLSKNGKYIEITLEDGCGKLMVRKKFLAN